MSSTPAFGFLIVIFIYRIVSEAEDSYLCLSLFFLSYNTKAPVFLLGAASPS